MTRAPTPEPRIDAVLDSAAAYDFTSLDWLLLAHAALDQAD